jgi:hypothetical protein
LIAEVSPTPLPQGTTNKALTIAEAARHLAILGSCAARLEFGGEGRVYYPVRESTLRYWSGAPLPEFATARAQCTQFDPRTSQAVAFTELRSSAGELICSFEVTYHVIAEAEFRVLFSAHQQPTQETNGLDPYTSFEIPQALSLEIGAFEGVIERVAPEGCLGHFVDYPAYPVSIMVRDGLAAAHLAICKEHGFDSEWVVEGGRCHAERFIFAGEPAQLTLNRLSVTGAQESWRCNIMSGKTRAAWFDLEVQITRSQLPDLESRRVQTASPGQMRDAAE